MALLPAVEALIEASALTPSGEVVAENLRAIAEQLDEGDATSAVQVQLRHQLILALERLTDGVVETGAPRLGLLRGRPARDVLLGLGYTDVDRVDLDRFDAVSALKLKRDRRRLGLPEHVGLQAVIDSAIERQSGSAGRSDAAGK
jgi:hypothetical protein